MLGIASGRTAVDASTTDTSIQNASCATRTQREGRTAVMGAHTTAIGNHCVFAMRTSSSMNNNSSAQMKFMLWLHGDLEAARRTAHQ
jgi:hypothetical protein